MKHLTDELLRYAGEGVYPYHMPGHKRRSCGMLSEDFYRMDITEIDGFDNLHQPEGMIAELQRAAARLYGAEESFYLINGSTCGILSAVSAALSEGGHILMARNCHKSAYHGVYLRNLRVTYLYPPYLDEYDIFDAVTPQQIEDALEAEPDIRAVLIVSPTYEGRIADIRRIADIVHRRGIPLIVDEAHGAHLGLADMLPENSCQAGADLVIHSVHKTLPAPTQTALLHVNGTLVDRGLLRRFLRIYQSSSPSYPLMAGIDNALRYIEESGGEAFREFWMRFREMTGILTGCSRLKFLFGEPERQDVGKLLISVKEAGLTGKELYDILLKKYRLQPEMASGSFVLAMFTVNDGQEAYECMVRALLEIDAGLEGKKEKIFPAGEESGIWAAAPKGEGTGGAAGVPGVTKGDGKAAEGSLEGEAGQQSRTSRVSEDAGKTAEGSPEAKPQSRIPLSRAWDMPSEIVALEESAGRYAGEFVNLYPPGVPLLVPGERITEKLCRDIIRNVEAGLSVQGVRVDKNGEAPGGKICMRVLRL